MALLALLCLLLSCNVSNAVILAWDANIEEDLAGYKLYRGYAPGVYDTIIDVGNVTTYEVTGLALDQGYYFAVTAYDSEDPILESGFSNEVFYLAQAPAPFIGSTISYVLQECDEPPPVAGLKLGVDYDFTELPDGSILYIYYNLSPGQRVRLEY